MRIAYIALALAGLAPVKCWAAGPFDGSWTVAQTCPPTADDVRGFSWTYSVVIRSGALSGRHAPSTPQDGSVRLDGRIQADGSALLNAAGETGRSEYSVGHVAPGFKYHYHVRAQFTGSSGTGSRIEQRPCDFAFAKN